MYIVVPLIVARGAVPVKVDNLTAVPVVNPCAVLTT